MQTRLSGHGAYRHEYHIVWIPKYRKKVLTGRVKESIEGHMRDIERYHPEVRILQWNIQIDHVHMVAEIPPKYGVSMIVGKIKANTSRKVRSEGLVKGVYWGGAFWSPGFFSSTVGLDEEMIQKYVKYQEKVDTEEINLKMEL